MSKFIINNSVFQETLNHSLEVLNKEDRIRWETLAVALATDRDGFGGKPRPGCLFRILFLKHERFGLSLVLVQPGDFILFYFFGGNAGELARLNPGWSPW